MVLNARIFRLNMFSILAVTIVIFDITLSFELRDTGILNESEIREKRESRFMPVVPSEVKEEFRDYAKSYLNRMVTQLSKRNEEPEKRSSSTARAQICAEVCQHRCLPSCEWSCCIKENIEEYRSAHLVKPLAVRHPSIQRISNVAKADKKTIIGKSRARVGKARGYIDEPIKDGHECNPSCKRFCVPACRFACCQPVQIKGVLLI